MEQLPGGVERGMFVAVCAPTNIADLGRDRGYLARGPCPGDTEPLLKVVAGVPGDEVTVSTRGVAVNGCVLPNSAPLAFDRSDRPLKTWPLGRYDLGPKQLWLYAGNPRSWDSRYWGPATTASLIARAVPLLVVASFPFYDEGAGDAARFAGAPGLKIPLRQAESGSACL